MMKKRLLFVGHGVHVQTASSQFFETLLEQRFDLDRVYLDDGPHQPFDIAVLDRARQADVVVLWQRDFLAPAFLSVGVPTIVVPMYDGSALFPDSHWQFSAEAHFANFCLYLNEKIRALGSPSLLLRYFPQPVPPDQRVRFDSVRPFLWTRRPNEGINLESVRRLLGDSISSIHVHDAPDPGVELPAHCVRKDNFGYAVTRTAWSSSKQPYLDALSNANVYIAPRLAEGIGMGFLEAMARGMVVLAWDLPTHNEYISNWLNGILYDAGCSHIPLPDSATLDAMGYQAWRTVAEGRKTWEAQESSVLDWIEQAAPPTRMLDDPTTLAQRLWQSFFGGLESYLSFLDDNAELVAYMSGGYARRRGNIQAPHDERNVFFAQIDSDDIEKVRNSRMFDANWYMNSYPDVRLLNMDPAAHYIWIGRQLGRPGRAPVNS